MRIVESKEVVGVDNDDSRDYWSGVWSQTRREVYHDVHNTRDGWRCRCESYRLGHKIVCQHMVAAFIPAALGPRRSKKKADTSSELPERWCRHCGSADVAWSESRLLRRMSAPEETGADRHICGTCGRRFADRPCLEGRHYPEDVISYAIRLVARNMLPRDAAETIKDAMCRRYNGDRGTPPRWTRELISSYHTRRRRAPSRGPSPYTCRPQPSTAGT